MKSQFLQLFTRGRYVTTRSIAYKESKAESPLAKHEERERFAVAAIAFCLEHDEGFKSHFLKVVAHLSGAAIKTINVEPERWGDLVLEGSNEVVVLEFKLGALLVEHQDPRKPLFKTVGYGADIKRKYGETNSKKVRYAVVGKDFDAGTTDDGLDYCAVPWSALLYRGSSEPKLVQDLYDCLGTLGATVFLSRTMTRKTATNEALGAMDLYKLLSTAANGFQIGEADSGIDHIGLNILKKGAASGSSHARLNALVKPTSRVLGWIGFERLEKLSLSVWYYCPMEETKTVKKKLKQLGIGEVSEDGGAVGLSSVADDESDHEAWFRKALLVV